jgi:hypothetical protein
MRGRLPAVLLACVALAQAGCGSPTAAAASYSCGYMRDTVGAFRKQARLLVAREGFKTSALSIEEGVLDVELLLRDACRGTADRYEPYARVARAAPGAP